MAENYKRRFVSSLEEDRISNLPEHLIGSILERLLIQDAVRTSIISESWRYRWTKMIALIFDKQFTEKYAKIGDFDRNGFIRIINKVMLFHKGPILKFHLHIPKISLDSFEEVDQWISVLSRNGVRELDLTNSNQFYEFPSYVFSCLELTKLKLENCFFKPPLKFGGFPNIEDLYLRHVDFRSNMFRTQINFPQLKKLFLHSCTNVYNFNINAPKLVNLTVTACPDAILLDLLHSPCLTVFSTYFLKPIGDNTRVEKISLTTLSSNLTQIGSFLIDGRFLKFISADNTPKWLAHPLNSINRLLFHKLQLGDLDQLHGFLCFLRNSPNLKELNMEMEPPVDVGPASHHLESPDCLECTFNHLETVEITSLEGSRPELLFIKLLLAHSPSLEKLTITPSGKADAQKRFDIAKDIVMWFPRASPNAKIMLNPEP